MISISTQNRLSSFFLELIYQAISTRTELVSKRPNVYFLIYFPLVLVLYNTASLTKADMFYITIGLVHCEVKEPVH